MTPPNHTVIVDGRPLARRLLGPQTIADTLRIADTLADTPALTAPNRGSCARVRCASVLRCAKVKTPEI